MARFRDEDVRMALNICAARAGYSLRPLQEQVISFVQGSDVFVGLLTGSGKSLLQHSSRRFQLAAESKVVHCRYSKSPNRTDERPGTGTIQKPGEFVFPTSRMRKKNGLVHETTLEYL